MTPRLNRRGRKLVCTAGEFSAGVAARGKKTKTRKIKMYQQQCSKFDKIGKFLVV